MGAKGTIGIRGPRGPSGTNGREGLFGEKGPPVSVYNYTLIEWEIRRVEYVSGLMLEERQCSTSVWRPALQPPRCSVSPLKKHLCYLALATSPVN